MDFKTDTALALPGSARPVQCKRPIIMVCRDLPNAPDLLENAIVLRLKERPAKEFKSRAELDRMFSEQHGKALGGLAKACSLALEHLDTIELDAVQRDADLERWVMALDKGLGLGDRLLAALQTNLEQTLTDIIEERPAIRAFLALVKAKGSVKATATELLDEIEPFLDGPKDPRYPTTGKALAKLLRDYKRYMTDIEIEFDVRTGKDRDRNIVARWQGPKGTVATSSVSASAKTKPRKAQTAAQDQPTFF